MLGLYSEVSLLCGIGNYALRLNTFYSPALNMVGGLSIFVMYTKPVVVPSSEPSCGVRGVVVLKRINRFGNRLVWGRDSLKLKRLLTSKFEAAAGLSS